MAIKSVISIINGTEQTLTLNSSTGYYEKTVTAPSKSSYSQSGHYYPVTIKATDTAGNVTTVNNNDATFGTTLRLQVIEKTAPVITVSYPGENALLIDQLPTITWTVTDNDSGVDPNTIKLKVDTSSISASSITKSAITGGYACSYVVASALNDGSHTLYFDANDYDGNAATQRTVNFKVDTVPPELNVTSPTNNLITNNKSLVVSGTVRDVTTGIKSFTLSLNKGTAQNITISSNNNWSIPVTLVEGSNTITIRATDQAGKFSEITRTVILDSKAPVISEITLTPNPVSVEASVKISVKVTD